jgi:MFS family permease
MALVLSPISGRIVGRRGARGPLLLAGIGLSVSPLLLIGLDPTTPIGLLLGSYLIFGIGFGMINPPITNTAVAGMPAAQAGVAAAVASTSRQIGQTLGIAAIGAVAGAGAGKSFGPGFARATHPAWWIIAGLGLIVLVVGQVTTTSWAEATARRTAQQLN